MDLIKQFMKIGGFKTPKELEAYGEENFFRDFPEAKQMAMGGTPEAFNMSMPADKFFSYGVPVPPTYYAEGGSLTNRMVFPQIQSADQFFSPVYSNSNNAYAKGGNIEEFPQAISYPQGNWGKTNYYMLGEGGTFPPGMPQYTGMLPVMQTGADLSGILSKTEESSDHYGITAFQTGGENPTDSPDQTFYTNKMNQFMDKIRGTAYKKMADGIMSEANPFIEEMPEPGARYGGQPLEKYQTKGQVSPFLSKEEAFQINAQQQEKDKMQEVIAWQNWARQEQYKKQHAGLSEAEFNAIQNSVTGSSKPAPAPAAAPPAKPKSGTKTQAGVSKTVEPSTNNPTIGQNRRSWEKSQGIISEPSPRNGDISYYYDATWDGTKWVEPTSSSNTNATGTTPTGREGWQKVILNGKEGYINPETNQFYTPYTESDTTNTTTQQQQAWPYDPMWVMPGRYRPGRITRGMDAYLEALAAGQIARGDVKLSDVDERRAILPGNRIKSMTFSVPGSGDILPTPNYYIDQPGNKGNQKNRLKDFFRGRQDKTSSDAQPLLTTKEPSADELIQPGTYDPNVKKAYDYNFRQGQGNFPPSGGWQEFPGTMEKIPVGPVAEQRYGGPFALPMFHLAGEVMTQLNPDTLKAIQFSPDDDQDEIMNPIGYQPENKPFTPQEASAIVDDVKRGPDKKFKFKPGRQKGPGLGPDAILAMMRAGTNLFEKMGWNKDNQNFNSALSAYGMPRKPTDRGDYLTNDPGMGNTFRPDQYNWNKRGFYAPDYGFAQTGGQQFANMDGDQYYLTQEQINKVIKAGGRVPGF